MSLKTETLSQREELQGRIASAHSEFQELLDSISGAETAKTKAKEKYNISLDRGDSKAMADALRTIRESNSKIETLNQEFKGYPDKENSLRELVNQTIAAAREKQPPAEQLLKDAQKHVKEIEAMVGRCLSLQNEINNLNIFIQDETRALRKEAE